MHLFDFSGFSLFRKIQMTLVLLWKVVFMVPNQQTASLSQTVLRSTTAAGSTRKSHMRGFTMGKVLFWASTLLQFSLCSSFTHQGRSSWSCLYVHHVCIMCIVLPFTNIFSLFLTITLGVLEVYNQMLSKDFSCPSPTTAFHKDN